MKRASVGIRDMRDRLSAVLRRVQRGETITVTDRNRPVALLIPVTEATAPEAEAQAVRRLVEAGRLSWSGGKPAGATRPAAVHGALVSQAVTEDRR